MSETRIFGANLENANIDFSNKHKTFKYNSKEYTDKKTNKTYPPTIFPVGINPKDYESLIDVSEND